MTFKQCFDEIQVHPLEEFRKIAHTSRYGHLGSVHAFYCLMWGKPEVMNGPVQQMLHEVRQWLGVGASSKAMKSIVHMAARLLVDGEATGVEHGTTMLPEVS